MKNSICGIALFSVCVLVACSSRSAYDALQERNKVECQNLPQAEYDKCMAKAGTSYDEYEAKRKELEKTSRP